MAIVKDWALEAAREIWSIAWEHHGIAPPESKIVKVIEKHCPFKRGVAYMPVPRCETCRHWTPDGKGKQGDCDLAVLGTSNFNVYSDDGAGLETSADFGCVQWEAK